MNWKSYTLVTGAGVIATWFAAQPPVPSPVVATASTAATQTLSAAARSTSAAVGGSDIEQQAARLQQRLREEALYREPSRNPFRFGARPASALRRQQAPADATPVDTAALQDFGPQTSPLPMTLAGLAIDETMRTAVLSTRDGVVLAQAGDEVLGYRVASVGDASIELVRLDDGTMVTLSLK